MCESFELVDLGDAAIETRQVVPDFHEDSAIGRGLKDPSL
jgi:hypothetical protein